MTEQQLKCRVCGRKPISTMGILGWTILGWTIELGPAMGGPKRRPKGGLFTCFQCTRRSHEQRALKGASK